MLIALVLAAAVETASPSPAPSATPAPAASPSAKPALPVFSAPPGWTPAHISMHIPAGYTNIGSYRKLTATSPHFLNVISGPSGGLSVKDYASLNIEAIRADRKIKVLTSHATTICSGRPAWIAQFSNSSPAYPQKLTQVYAVSATAGYVLTYTRLAKAPDAPGLNAVLQSLCVPAAAAFSGAGPVPFDIPKGWREANPDALGAGTLTGAAVGVWLGPLNGLYSQTLGLTKGPGTNGTIEDAAKTVQGILSDKFANFKMRSSHPQQLCGKLPGWYFEYTATLQDRNVLIEQTLYTDRENSYALTYGRAAGAPEDAAAHNALLSLCPQEGAAAG